jgi:uncharacterized protein
MASYLSPHPHGVCLAVKVQPRAARNEICEAVGRELKIKVTAPPVDSAANEALVRFLAERLALSRGSVELLRGATSRHKLLLLHGVTLEFAEERLRAG